MPTFAHNDVNLHYQIDGTIASHPMLVLSNSLGTSLSMWDAQIEALTQHFQVLRYDTRGHGLSGTGSQSKVCGLADLSNDVLRLLDHIGIERAHICGVSLGGMTALWLGLNAPQRVMKVIAAANAAHTEMPEFWNARIDTVRREGMIALVDGVLERFFGPAFHKANATTIAAFREEFVKTSSAGYIAGCEAIRDLDLRDALANMDAPTLALAGTQDMASPPANSLAIAQRIPDGYYAEIAASHLLNVEAPGAFNRAVIDFLTEAGSR